MSVVLSCTVGLLYAIGLYLMLRRNLAKLIIGLSLLTNAANLLIFTVGGLTRGRPPLVPEGETVPLEAVADPLPQALILTAIVIGFGVLAFAMVLSYRADQGVDTDDLDEMRTTDYIVRQSDAQPLDVSAGERTAVPPVLAQHEPVG